MVISLHDRISSHANRVRVLERFLAYAKSKPGVWFAHKDEIAKWAVVSIGRSRRSTTAARRRIKPSSCRSRCPVSVARLSILMHLRLYGDEHPALLANRLRVCRLRHRRSDSPVEHKNTATDREYRHRVVPEARKSSGAARLHRRTVSPVRCITVRHRAPSIGKSPLRNARV
jgi:hypothetical protein